MNKIYKNRLIINSFGLLIILILLTNTIYAENSGAEFLKFPINARCVGLGEAFSTYRGTIDVVHSNPAGIASVYSNPAGITSVNSNPARLKSVNKKEISYSHLMIGGDIDLSLEYLCYGQTVKKNSFAFGITYLHTPFTEFGDQGEQISESSIYDLSFNCAYARRTRILDIGLNIKYILRSLSLKKAHAFAADFGIIFKIKFLNSLINGDKENLFIGTAIRNLGTKIKFFNQGSYLPSSYNIIGFGYKIINNIMLILDLDRYLFEKRFKFHIGVEFSIKDIVYFRFGDRIENIKNHFCLGGGVNIRIKKFNLTFDYGISIEREFGNLHAISVKIGF